MVSPVPEDLKSKVIVCPVVDDQRDSAWAGKGSSKPSHLGVWEKFG